MLQTAADKVNKILKEQTNGMYFVSPSKRALRWFKLYDWCYVMGQTGGYSISRTDARMGLLEYDIDLDALLASVGLS